VFDRRALACLESFAWVEGDIGHNNYELTHEATQTALVEQYIGLLCVKSGKLQRIISVVYNINSPFVYLYVA